MIVQNAFAANLISNRDVGISILSDEDQYRFNYALGIWNGAGPNLARDGTSVSQAVLPPTGAGGPPAGTTRTYNYDTRFLNGEMMYTARLLFKIAGNPGYGQGDILNSRTPQAAIAFGYAYNPGSKLFEFYSVRYRRPRLPPRGRKKRQRTAPRAAASTISKPMKWILSRNIMGGPFNRKAIYRHQRVRHTDSGTVPFDLSTIPAPQFLGPPVDLGQAWGWYVTGRENISFLENSRSRSDMA